MDIVHPLVIEYLRHVQPVKDPIIDAMRRYSREQKSPTIGTLGGQLLAQLSLLIGAKAVFELGSNFGYSTLWFARALPPDGNVHLTQPNIERAVKAKEFLQQAGVLDRIVFHTGDPLEALLAERGPFDIIMLNLGPKNLAALPAIRDRLRAGGLLVTPSCFQQGRVIRQSDDTGVQNQQIFNHTISHDPAFVTTFHPIRDGIAVSWKKP